MVFHAAAHFHEKKYNEVGATAVKVLGLNRYERIVNSALNELP